MRGKSMIHGDYVLGENTRYKKQIKRIFIQTKIQRIFQNF